jgi:cytochrome c oxidase subunit II
VRRHPIAQMLLYGAIASIIGLVIVLGLDWFPKPASTAAEDIDTLYDVLLIFSIPIFVLVMTVAIYCMVKFRAKPGDMSDGPPIHGNTRLEVFWVTIPFLIVSGLAAYGWIVLDRIEDKKADEMVIEVTGQQFTWSFRYPSPTGGPPVQTTELVLQKDKPVKFEIRAIDVIHSFWVPEFRMKQDAVPGIETSTRVTPNSDGTYSVVCAELCGIGHATMRQNVRVVGEQEFAGWLDEQARTAARQPPGGGGGGNAGGGNGGGGANGGGSPADQQETE